MQLLALALALRLSGSSFPIECVGNFIWPTSFSPHSHTQTHTLQNSFHGSQGTIIRERAKQASKPANRKQRTEKTWPKIDYGNGWSARGSKWKRTWTWQWMWQADQATIIKILLVGPCNAASQTRIQLSASSSELCPCPVACILSAFICQINSQKGKPNLRFETISAGKVRTTNQPPSSSSSFTLPPSPTYKRTVPLPFFVLQLLLLQLLFAQRALAATSALLSSARPAHNLWQFLFAD